MSTKLVSLPDLGFQPVTPDRWQDLEVLFGKNGAYSGCWCMWWRETRSQFGKQAGQGNDDLNAII
jgi:hypothetical protein